MATLVWGDGTEGQLGHYPFEKTGVMQHYWELLPRELPLGPLRDISCGTNHTLAIDADGQVWSWGKSDYGKCGHGGDADQPFPKKVEALAGVDAVLSACGEFHSAVVDSDGRLYTWGWGGSWFSGGGQLGHGDRASLETPKLVEALERGGYRVQSVSCGEAHTLVLTDDGEGLSCGAGEHGRNGNGSSRDVLVPEPLDLLESETLTQLEAGSAFSMALTSDNDVFVWGRNDQGQLGLGGGLAMDVYSMEDTPRPLEIVPAGDDAAPFKMKALHVAAGHSHAAAVTTDGHLYYWGMRAHLDPFVLHFEDDAAPPKLVYAGGNYTYVATEDGAYYSFGLGRTTCLGHGDRQGHAHPFRVEALNQCNLTHLACGFRHVACLTRSVERS